MQMSCENCGAIFDSESAIDAYQIIDGVREYLGLACPRCGVDGDLVEMWECACCGEAIEPGVYRFCETCQTELINDERYLKAYALADSVNFFDWLQDNMEDIE